MPELQNVKVNPRTVKVGDQVFPFESAMTRWDMAVSALDAPVGVTEVKVGTKLVHLTLDTGRKLHIATTDEVLVQREVETEEEKNAKLRAYVASSLRDTYDELTGTDYVDQFIAKMNKARENNYAEIASHWDVEKFLKANALHTASSQLVRARNTVENRAKELGVELDVDTLIIDTFAAWYATEVLKERSYPNDPTSRSTSTISNLMEDLERWAVEQIIYDVRYIDMVKTRALEMQAQWKESKNA